MTLEILYHDASEMILRNNELTIILNLKKFFNLIPSSQVVGCVWNKSESQMVKIIRGSNLHKILIEVLSPTQLSVG